MGGELNRIDLQNRVAVIAGVGSALGAATCARFAAGGARVVAWDGDPDTARRTAEALPAGGALARGGRGPETGTHGFAVVDFTDAAVVELAVTDTVARFGRIDILVCLMGAVSPGPRDGWVAGWKRAFDLAVHGTLVCTQAVARRMAAQGYGRVVHVASTHGRDGPQAHGAGAIQTDTIQAAVVALTRTLGDALAGSGVRLACVTTAAQRATVLDAMTRQHIEQMLAGIPLGRSGPEGDVAAAIAWLASEECAAASGTIIHLDATASASDTPT